MGFVTIRVSGKTFNHRRDLMDSHGLEYDFRKKDFKGAFPDESQRVVKLKQFCVSKKLVLEIDGETVVEQINYKKPKQLPIINENDISTLDEFNLKQWLPILAQTADESQIGKLGERVWSGLKDNLKFKEVEIEKDDTFTNGWDELSVNTQFHPLRNIQKQVLDEVIIAIDEGYQNIVVECPTGSGKSAIAKTIAQTYSAPSYIITHLKGLQAQYLKEMPYMKSIMGRGNYDCMLDVEGGLENIGEAQKALENVGNKSPGTCSAALAPCKFAKGFKCTMKNPVSPDGEWDFSVDDTKLCDYFGSLTKAQNALYFVGNTAYMMAMNRSGKMIKERPFLIVDEAHQLANNMMSFFSLSLSQRVLEKLFKTPTATDVKNQRDETKRNRMQSQREIILKVFDPASKKLSFGIPKISSVKLTTTPDERKKGLQILGRYLMALHDEIKRRMKIKDTHMKYDKSELSFASNTAMRIMALLESIATHWENWVWQVDDSVEYSSWVSFKPLNVADYAEDILLNAGQRRILLSGTILDYDIFGRELGLKKDSTCFIKVNYSPFEEINRPIYTKLHGGKLSRKDMGEESFKKTAATIAKIANKYPEKKGLILPFTDTIEKGVVEALQCNHPLVYARIRQHNKNPRERDAVFREFEAEKNNDILISTYANQGFDGKMIAFTVIPKVPFGPLGDIQVKTKAENDPKWYQLMTAIELAQMCGRGVRHEKDKGDTYIIDPSFWFHFERGFNNPLAKLLPPYVTLSILHNRYKGD